jgi:NAD(P)H-hydrate epimerase
MRILNAAQIREADRVTIEEIGISSIVLMENAGRQVVSAIENSYEEFLDGRVAVLCGRGNNGGDGLVVARTLLQRHIDVSVFLLAPVSEMQGDALLNLEILSRLGFSIVEITDEQTWELHFSEISECSLVVDALFGTGLKEPLSGMLETVVADLNACGIPLVSIDLPSGLSADTSLLPGVAINASMTVTLAAPKLPLVLPPGENQVGDLVVADIGIPDEVIKNVKGLRLEFLTRNNVIGLIEPRVIDAHKGDFGRVSLVAGSQGKTGAAYLAAMGALKSGAGLVSVATPSSCLPTISSLAPEFMIESLDEDTDGQVTGKAISKVLQLNQDVIACGPGIGRGAGVTEFIKLLLDRAEVPLVLDADALTAISGDPGCLIGRDERDVIITPHPGEMGSLVGCTSDEIQSNRIEIAKEFSITHRIYVVLKGHRTVIATPSGDVFVNSTGNAGMATGGTGDILTGMIAAWLAQTLDPEAACQLGVYLHGMAGDITASTEGEVSMTAVDLLGNLGEAIASLMEPEGNVKAASY